MNHKITLSLACGLALLAGCANAPARAENIVFPADAGVLNVRDLGVKGDGTTDDTAALQAAIDKYHAHPKGTGFSLPLLSKRHLSGFRPTDLGQGPIQRRAPGFRASRATAL